MMRPSWNIAVVLLFVGSSLVAGVQPVEAQLGAVLDDANEDVCVDNFVVVNTNSVLCSRVCFSDGKCDDGADIQINSSQNMDPALQVFLHNSSIKLTTPDGTVVWIDEGTADQETIVSLVTQVLTDVLTILLNEAESAADAAEPVLDEAGPVLDEADPTVRLVRFALFDALCGLDPDLDPIVCGALNAPPTINDGNKTVFEDHTLAFPVNASDDDGDPLQYSMSTNTGATLNATTGNFSWTPGPGSAGTYYANLTVNDTREIGWKNITITVLEPAVSITANVTDGFSPLAVQFTLDALDESLVANATFDEGKGDPPGGLEPFTNQAIDVTYPSAGTYTAWINGTYDGTPFRHNVTIQVDEPPLTLGPIGDQRVFEQHELTFVLTVTNNETEDPVTYQMTSDAPGATLNETNRRFDWSPGPDTAGSYYANFTVNDTKEKVWENVTITVLEPAVSITANVTDGFSPLAVEFTLNATNESLVAAGATFDNGQGGPPENLATFTNTTRTVTYGIGTYTAWINGTYDGIPFTHNLTLLSRNNPPVLDEIPDPPVAYTGEEVAFTATASDADGHALVLTVTTNVPAQDVFTDQGDGSADFSWVPGPGQNGTYYANITVTDPLGSTANQNVTIQVGPRSTDMTSTWPGGVEVATVTFTLTATEPDQLSDATFDDGKGTVTDLNPFQNQTRAIEYGPGTYIAWFNGTHTVEGSFNHEIPVTVLPESPTNFTATGTMGKSPLPVTFTLNATDWAHIQDATLDPGNGSMPESVDLSENGSVVVIYDQNGTYTAWFNGTHAISGPFSHSAQVHLNNSAPVISAIDDITSFGGRNISFLVPVTDADAQDGFTLELDSNATGASVDSATGEFHWLVPQTTTGTFYANITANDTKASDWHNFSIIIQSPSTTLTVDDDWGSAPHDVRFMFKTPEWGKISDSTFTNGTELHSAVVFVADGAVDAVYDEPGDYVAWFNGTHETEGAFWYSINVTVVENTPPEFTDAISDQIVVKNHTLDFTVTASDAEDTDLVFGLQTNATGHTSHDLHPTNARNFTWTPTQEDIGWYYANFTVDDGKGGLDWMNITITVTPYSTVLRSSAPSGYAPHAVTYRLDATDPSLVAANATFEDGLGTTTDLGAFSNQTIVVTYASAGTYTAWFNGTWFNGTSDVPFNHSLVVTVSINQDPVLQHLSAPTIRENALLRITVLATDDEDGPEGLTYAVATDIPDGYVFADNATGGKDFSWQTQYGDAGTYYANFTVEDGNGGMDWTNTTITVVENQPPSIQPIDDRVVVEGIAFTIDIEATDDEAIAAADVAVSPEIVGYLFDPVADEPGSWRFSWSPPFGSAGTYYANFTATDAEGLTDHRNVTLTVYNSPPVLADIDDRSIKEGDRVTFTPTATDPDGHALTYSIDSDLPMEPGNQASFDAGTGEFSWTAVVGDAGTYSVEFTVTDGGIAVRESVTLTVLQNHAPALDPIGDRFVEAGDPLRIHVNASDADGDDLVFGSLGTQVPGAVYTVNGTAGGMDLAWTPGAAHVGVHNVNFTVQDNAGATDFERVTITVRPSVPPVLDPIDDVTVQEGEVYETTLTAVDPGDEEALVFSLESNSSDASIQGDILRFAPGEGGAGLYWAKITVTDDDGFTDSQDITLTVTPADPQAVTQGIQLHSTAGGVRAATTAERQALTDIGFDVTDEDEVAFVDDDGDGDIDSIKTTSGRIQTAHDLESLAILVLVDTQTDKMAVMDFNTGKAYPVTEIEDADIEVEEQGRQGGEDRVAVTVPKEDGWIHIAIDDPAPGQAIASLERSDGVILKLDQAWRTEDGRLHIIDDPDTTYTVGFEPGGGFPLTALWITVAVLGALLLAGAIVAAVYWMRRRAASRDGGAMDDSWALASESSN